MDSYSLVNGVLVTPGHAVSSKTLRVDGNLIVSQGQSAFPVVDLHGDSYIYPALINVHDHLRGNYLPRVGPSPGRFYLNWLPWDNDLKSSDTYVERSNLSVDDLYLLSAYKNLFSGVVTVNDHFPHELNDQLLPTLPIRAIQEYCLAHECSSFDLKWGEGIEIEHDRALKNNWPFITHLEEGFDAESQDGIGILERLGRLDDHCVLIHCIGFSDQDIAKVAKSGASVSWCPASNMFMFNVTCKIKKMLKAGVNVAIGTDSTHTGSVNLLEEVRFARRTYQTLYGEDIPAQTLFEMVTINPARAFRMADRIGSLDTGKWADVVLFKRRLDDPYENLAQGTMEDIQLLIMAGRPIYGEIRFLELLGGKLPADYSLITVAGRSMFVKGNPGALYAEVRRKVAFKKVLDYLPFEPEV